ncbi:MAG: DUF4058 family protein [Gemmataceae bacterium]|nr:DUF4058 family protein [Gemmataceae bacterium]
MPVHDWTRVKAGIFSHFHHEWISEIARALNAGVLPEDYYALAEQHAVGFGPDVLTLQGGEEDGDGEAPRSAPSGRGTSVLTAPPKARLLVETDRPFYHRKRSTVVVRHVSGDRVVAMVEVVSPGNKNTRNGLRSFVEKAAELLEKRVHLLILDLHPPGKRDPYGLHAAIWEEVAGEEAQVPPEKPLTLASYESSLCLRAFVEPVAVGEALPDMPLFLEPEAYVLVPLEATYQRAFAAVPRRWQRVLEASAS